MGVDNSQQVEEPQIQSDSERFGRRIQEIRNLKTIPTTESGISGERVFLRT